MQVFISGKVRGLKNHKELFKEAISKLEKRGDIALYSNLLPPGLRQGNYIHICYAMIDVCDVVYFLKNWEDSEGAKKEHKYALENNKLIEYQ